MPSGRPVPAGSCCPDSWHLLEAGASRHPAGDGRRLTWETRRKMEDAALPEPSPAVGRLLEWLRESAHGGGIASSGPSLEVLELGCGRGQDSLALAAAGHRVLATDFALPSLELQPTLPDLRFALLDVRFAFPVESCRFDLVVSHLLFSCDFTEDELRCALGEVARVLRPGGVLWLVLRSTDDPTYLTSHQPGAGRFLLGNEALFFFSQKKLRSLCPPLVPERVTPRREQVRGELYGVLEAVLRRA